VTALRRTPWLSGIALALCAVAVLLAITGAAIARDSDPSAWEAGEQVREALFDVRSELAFGDRAEAVASARSAQRIYDRSLERIIRSADPAANRAAEKALAAASAAVVANDVDAAAAAQGAAWAAILRGAVSESAKAASEGDAELANEWLLLRDFRSATRFTRPATDATDAITQLKENKISPAAAKLAVEKDLLDTYQARLRELLADVAAAQEKDFKPKSVEAAAQAEGYWQILRPRYRQDLGQQRLKSADAAFARYQAAVESGDESATKRAKIGIDEAFDGFVAAPFTAKEEARRAQQLFRFLELVPFEYEQGVEDGRVTADFEIQEAVGFRNGAEQAFGDLKGKLDRRDPVRTEKVAVALEELRVILTNVQQGGKIETEAKVEQITNNAIGELKAEAPPAWSVKTDESDFDLINLTLDRMDAAISQGQWAAAEQARLETYAFLEFGPELKLKAFDPHLSLELEGLIWYGAQGEKGMAALIANHADRQQVRPTRLALDKSLAQAQATLGEDQSAVTAVVNGAILVFREGLEAVLILAAITASMLGAMAARKRAVLWGAALGLVLSIVTWGVAQLVLGQLGQYGEKLEAVVGIIAIFVLLYVMNWFFHKVYWTEHIRKFHDRRRKLVGDTEGEEEEETEARVGFWSGQAVGFALLGLSSVYREGFETVLFLQSLQLATDTWTVVMGALLGLALTLIVAVITFKLQRKLPYKRMLIVTGVMLAVVLFVLVGNTVRSLQGIGWMPVTPLDWEPPLWVGTWLGIFPSWQSLGLQVFSVTLVVGSYFLAEELRVKGPERRAARADAVREAAAALANEPGEDPQITEPAEQSESREREPVA
jgi:high-affinity iron transporter